MVLVIMVLGEAPDREGIPAELRDRCDRAVSEARECLKTDERIYVVFTGGVTRQGQPAEAELAFDYCSQKLEEVGAVGIKDPQAMTTSENVLFTRATFEEANVQ